MKVKMFCPKCGSILVPKKEGTLCSCGYKSKGKEEATLKEEIKKTEHEIDVVVPEEVETLPLTDAECDKCGHNKAYFWLIQTRASDEPETKFYKCEQCKHVWRDYS